MPDPSFVNAILPMIFPLYIHELLLLTIRVEKVAELLVTPPKKVWLGRLARPETSGEKPARSKMHEPPAPIPSCTTVVGGNALRAPRRSVPTFTNVFPA